VLRLTILYLDGTSRDFQDFGCSGTQSSRRVDSQTVEILLQCANGGWTRFVPEIGRAAERSGPGDHGAVYRRPPIRAAPGSGEQVLNKQ
jgi:hypothetical protein